MRVLPWGAVPSDCQSQGEITVSVKNKIGFYTRNALRVQDELETLARNEALQSTPIRFKRWASLLTVHSDLWRSVAVVADVTTRHSGSGTSLEHYKGALKAFNR